MKSFQEFLTESSKNILGGFNIARSQMPQLNDQHSFLKFLDSIGISYNVEMLGVDSIKPTQIDIDINKVDALKENLSPIIVSSDMFILDGHHRFYSNVIKLHPFINTIVVDCTINKLLGYAYEFLDNAT